MRRVILAPMRLFILLFLAGPILLFGQHANASDAGNDRVRVSGFGTLGGTFAGKENLGYRKEYTHSAQYGSASIFPDSVFGLQIDANLFPKLSATVQAVAENKSKQNFNNIVDWAYLRYQLTPDVVVRGGRMGVDLFMLSEYRNVGFAYLWSHPVVEFYAPVSLSHYDGVDLNYTKSIDQGHLEFKVYGGQTGSDIKVSRGDFGVRMRPLFGANASFETNYWKTRISFATTNVASTRNAALDRLLGALDQVPPSLWPQAAGLSDEISGEGNRVNYYSIGMSYDKDAWLVQSEFALTDSKWPSVAITNGYLSVGRRVGPVTFYTIGAYAKSLDKPTRVTPQLSDPALNQLQVITQNSMNAVHFDQNTVSLGMRWDFHPKMALKAQWDHTWVRKNGGGLLILKKPLDHDTTLNIFSLNLNFVF